MADNSAPGPGPWEPLPINPGGQLSPDQVIGRDGLVAEAWERLDEQSILFTAERRLGKTSVIRLMRARTPERFVAIGQTVEDCRTPEDLTGAALTAMLSHLPRKHRALKRLQALLESLGVSYKGATVTLRAGAEDASKWKRALNGLFRILDAHHGDRTVALFLDEFPFMLNNMPKDCARDVLDTLRAARHRHDGLRLVLSGSIGLHHLLDTLQEPDIAWAPVNDVLVIEVPPLDPPAAEELAYRLLAGTTLRFDDLDAVVEAIVGQTDRVPYYIHHCADDLVRRVGGGVCRPEDVRATVDAAIHDEQDRWHLGAYVTRVPRYYGARTDLAHMVLDDVARAGELSFDQLKRQIGGRADVSGDALRSLLDLLLRDHYLTRGPDRPLRFALDIVRRTWLAHRYLSP